MSEEGATGRFGDGKCKRCKQARMNREGGLCVRCWRAEHPYYRQPRIPQLLKDLRYVYKDVREAERETAAVKSLRAALEQSPMKVLELLEREEVRYRERVQEAWAKSDLKEAEAKAAAEPASREAAGEELLPEEPVQELIRELLDRVRGK